MGKYDALKSFLSSSKLDSIQIRFSDIERILGQALPRSAYTYNAWWANGGHSQANAWMEAGYIVDNVNFGDNTVTFSKTCAVSQRTASVFVRPASAPAKNIKPFPAVSCASDTMEVCGYTFTYVQDLIPKCDCYGKTLKYYPHQE